MRKFLTWVVTFLSTRGKSGYDCGIQIVCARVRACVRVRARVWLSISRNQGLGSNVALHSLKLLAKLLDVGVVANS